LLLGERVSAEMIRTGSERAFVEGIFEVGGNTPLIDLLSESGIEAEQDDLIIRREINPQGRSRIFVNNRAAGVSLLKAIQPHIIDLHGQGDQQSLLSAEAHMMILDAFAGSANNRQATMHLYDTLLKIIKELEDCRKSESEKLQSLDLVEYQIGEIEQARLVPGEDLDLQVELKLLANAEKISNLCAESYQFIDEEETSVLQRMAVIIRRMNDLAEMDSRFAPYLEQMLSIKHILDDTATFIRGYVEGVEHSPERLKFVDDRLAELDRLKRKYGKSIEEILQTKTSLIEKHEALLHSEERCRELEEQLRQILEQYHQEAEQLTQMRISARFQFEQAIGQELAAVALERGRFQIQLHNPTNQPLAERLELLSGVKSNGMRRSGKEIVEFQFSANPGEDLKPISAVASGGELSRLMLVLKTVIAPSQFPRTLIFDEIDAGIGGKVADAVGQRLRRLAQTNQVLCVTHQSQIARYADAHFHVAKEFADERTITRVIELDNEGRIEELARMIGGAEVTALARKHAKELLRTMSSTSKPN